MNPGRMPWAGMNDAFGVREASPELHRACLEEIRRVPGTSGRKSGLAMARRRLGLAPLLCAGVSVDRPSPG